MAFDVTQMTEVASNSRGPMFKYRDESLLNNYLVLGSGCGAVGRAVASDIRGPRFESSHRQLLLNIYLLLTVCRKDENKEKEAGNGPF